MLAYTRTQAAAQVQEQMESKLAARVRESVAKAMEALHDPMHADAEAASHLVVALGAALLLVAAVVLVLYRRYFGGGERRGRMVVVKDGRA